VIHTPKVQDLRIVSPSPEDAGWRFFRMMWRTRRSWASPAWPISESALALITSLFAFVSPNFYLAMQGRVWHTNQISATLYCRSTCSSIRSRMMWSSWRTWIDRLSDSLLAQCSSSTI